MHPHDRRVPRPRRHRPLMESLEARDLPSSIVVKPAPASLNHRPHAVAVQSLAHPAVSRSVSGPARNTAHTDSPNGLLGKKPPGSFLDPAVIAQFANLLYGPGSPTPMTPTAQEINRQIFTGRWVAQYTVGPPRFSDRASTIHVWSKTGGSDQFLKGKLDMTLFPTADPAATPTPGNPYANQLTGVVGLFNQNLLQSSGVLVLDIAGPSSAGSGPQALPTKLTWTYDNNTSAGPYAAPAQFTQGAGALDLKWLPDAHPLPGTMGSGKVIVTFQGLINSSQLVSGISKFIS
jgi:hypothetical protein